MRKWEEEFRGLSPPQSAESPLPMLKKYINERIFDHMYGQLLVILFEGALFWKCFLYFTFITIRIISIIIGLMDTAAMSTLSRTTLPSHLPSFPTTPCSTMHQHVLLPRSSVVELSSKSSYYTYF